MPDWVVNIVSSDSGDASFVVDFPGAKQGQPLQAQQDDLVSWYNQTNDDHQPWQTDSNYNPNNQSDLSDLIPAGQPSDNYNCTLPDAQPQSWAIYYYCNRHPDNAQERGSINLKALAKNSINIVASDSGVSFAPPERGAAAGDRINWNNTTTDSHQPWPTDENYQPLQVSPDSPQYMSDEIPPGETSLLYTVATPADPKKGGTTYYYCKLHPNDANERGTIVVPPKP
jgi:plastocyanin